jgi:hypothetical protein
MGLLKYQALPSLRDVAHDGVCVHLVPDWRKWCGPSGHAASTVHHVQDNTLLGPPASQAGRRVGSAL